MVLIFCFANLTSEWSAAKDGTYGNKHAMQSNNSSRKIQLLITSNSYLIIERNQGSHLRVPLLAGAVSRWGFCHFGRFCRRLPLLILTRCPGAWCLEFKAILKLNVTSWSTSHNWGTGKSDVRNIWSIGENTVQNDFAMSYTKIWRSFAVFVLDVDVCPFQTAPFLSEFTFHSEDAPTMNVQKLKEQGRMTSICIIWLQVALIISLVGCQRAGTANMWWRVSLVEGDLNHGFKFSDAVLWATESIFYTSMTITSSMTWDAHLIVLRHCAVVIGFKETEGELPKSPGASLELMACQLF